MIRLVFRSLPMLVAALSLPHDASAANEKLVSLRVISNPSNAISVLPANLTDFDLNSSRDRAALRTELAKLVNLSENQKKDTRKNTPNIFPYDIGGGERRALENCLGLLDQVDRGGQDGVKAARTIQILLASFNHSFEYPIQRKFQVLHEVPYHVIKGSHHLRVHPSEDGDEGRKDPRPSSYWTPRANDGNVDLKAGFGRAAAANVEKEICSYKGAKDGWGAHPGFHVECSGQAYKFKLGDEIYSGPFNTRLFWLMGYNVTPIDHVEQMKVTYDRKILSEFHSRKHLDIEFRLLGKPILRHVVTQYSDPFTWIHHAQMKDGRQISGAELKRLLLKRIPPGDPTLHTYQRPEVIPGNFREEFEAQIDHLAFVPGSLATNAEHIKPIGPWKYNEFDAVDRREVRAMLILAGWVSNYNMRWENTRLSYVKENGQWNLKHFFSDVGSGFGTATRALAFENAQVDLMLWRVTKPKGREGVKLSGIQQNDIDNDAFAAMTFEDGQWMVRKLAKLSEKQIWDAMGAAYLPAASRRLAYEKLISRRIHMVRDFGLAAEFPALVRRPINEEFNFIPTAKDGYGWNLQKVVAGKLVELKK